MPIAALTTGCIQSIMTGTDIDEPILQILGSKRIGGDSERYRLLVSDGKYLNSFAMLATQLNNLQNEDKLKEFTIIKVEKYTTSTVNKSAASDKSEKRVMVILSLSILNDGQEVGRKIGTPQTFNISDAPAPAAATPLRTLNNNTFNKNTNASMNQTINSDHLISPIASLSPYNNRWVIKVRLMTKSVIRTWNNPKGEFYFLLYIYCER